MRPGSLTLLAVINFVAAGCVGLGVLGRLVMLLRICPVSPVCSWLTRFS